MGDETNTNKQAKTPNAGRKIGWILFVVGFSLLGYVWWSEHSEKIEREEREKAAQMAREEEKKRASIERYSTLMAKMSKDPPGTLKHVTDDMARKPDTCQRTEDLQMDVCYWFLNEDQSMKVFSYSLAADGMAGTNPDKWVKAVVFARDDRVEKKIDGAIQQFLEGK